MEPEDFLPLAGIALLLGVGLGGACATWRRRPFLVQAAGLLLAVLAFISAWTIGLLFVPPALFFLLAAGALALSPKPAQSG